MKKAFLILLPIILLSSCKKEQAKTLSGGEKYKTEYANFFSVDQFDKYTVVNLINPWDTTKLLKTYVLVDRDIELPVHLPEGVIIRTPIQSAVVYSSVNCSFLNEIGKLDIVTGVCEAKYIKIPLANRMIESGKLIDVGEASNPDIEKILDLQPEVIFASPLDGQGFGHVEKTKIPIIQTVDYTEATPLARAEWIRFYSLFAGNQAKADSLFESIKNNYNIIKEAVVKIDNRPSVFLDTKYQDSWNIAGGRSYIAKMIDDAGGAYVWADDTSSKYLPLSFETVLDKAGEADMWLIKYNSPDDMTYKSLKNEYKPYSYFKAYKERNIYGCNTVHKTYFEDLPIHPDYILKDMAAIFHPELFPLYTPRYYFKLAE